jgi:peptidoglycan/LPS O-acetylase OafA/YrhL
VLGVLFYHSGESWLPGGFLGVDAFFVLSGFLITSLLVDERIRTGGIAFAKFWIRRARRLLPALFLLFLGVAVYAATVAAPTDLSRIRADGFASLGYIANWRFVFSGQSYFDQFAVPSPLRHLWSLAIEEQFYFIWPVVVFAVMRGRRAVLGRLLAVTVVLIVASAGLMAILYSPGSDPSRVYYGTDTRAQSMLIGAVVAILFAVRGVAHDRGASVALRVAGVLGAAYTLWAWSALDERSEWLYRGGYAVGAIAVAAVIAAMIQPRTGALGKGLSLRPIRWIGAISYGLYLWHWPLFLVLTESRTGLDGVALLAVRFATTFAIAAASYYLVEQPIRHGALPRWRGAFAVPLAAGLVAGAFVFSTVDARPSLADLAADRSTRAPSATELERSTAEEPPVRVLTVGDSVAFALSLGLQQTGPSDGLAVWNYGELGCSLERDGDPVLGGEIQVGSGHCAWSDRWPALLDQVQPDVVVALFGAWDVLDYSVQGRLMPVGTPERDALFLSELDVAADLLISRGSKLVLLTVPYFSRPEADTAAIWTEFQPWRVDHINALYRQWVRDNPDRGTLIDLNRWVSPGGQFADIIDGIQVRGDGVHFTAAGAVWVSEWLNPQLERIGLRHRTELAPAAEQARQRSTGQNAP